MLYKKLKKLCWGLLVVLFYVGMEATPAMAQKNKKLKIELGESFKNDQVKVFLDKDLVYDNRVTTPDSLTIADLFYVPKPRTPFMVTVEINGQKFEKSRPKQKKELDDEDYSLVINFNRESGEVELKTQTLIFLYD